MSHVITAEDLLSEIKAMPAAERGRFFALVGMNLFSDENSTHEQLFGGLAGAEFSAQEAAEYLEISIATFRRYVQGGKLLPCKVVGRSQFFAVHDLRALKRSVEAFRGRGKGDWGKKK